MALSAMEGGAAGLLLWGRVGGMAALHTPVWKGVAGEVEPLRRALGWHVLHLHLLEDLRG